MSELNLTWLDDKTFRTKHFTFDCSTTDYSRATTAQRVMLLKNRKLLSKYGELAREQPKNIFEIGFFHGGMPLLLADTLSPDKVVAIDRVAPNDAVNSLISGAGYSDKIKLHAPVNQADGDRLRDILDNEFGSTPLDLIADDCSHEYAETKSSFEATFGYLRPGGKFFIEDWAWAHWPGDMWQTERSYFYGRPALTNLVFEIIMAHASAPGIVASVELDHLAVVTRGPDLPYKARLELGRTFLTGTRQFNLL